MNLTVPEAAKLSGRNPETIRRWIRSGKLPAQKVGTQYLVSYADLSEMWSERLPLPDAWTKTSTGEPMPNVVALVRRSRESH